MFRGFWREIDQGLAELHRLRQLDGPRVPVAAALGASAFVMVFGNVVVLLGRRWFHAEWTTLVGVPALGLLGVLLLRLGGWTRHDLGFRWPVSDPRRPLSRWLFRTALFLALGCAALAPFAGESVTLLEVGRLLVGTAIGEEVVHRSAVLAAWAGTSLGARWVVAANVLTFALWHLAGANNETGFRWSEVIGPGVLTLPLLWARLRFRSVLAPAAFHGAVNMTGTLLWPGSGEPISTLA